MYENPIYRLRTHTPLGYVGYEDEIVPYGGRVPPHLTAEERKRFAMKLLGVVDEFDEKKDSSM